MFEGRLNVESLQARSLSAALLIPATLLIVYFGGWPFIILLALLGGVSFYEWYQLSTHCDANRRNVLLAAGVLYIGGSLVCCYLIPENTGFYWSVVFLLMVWGSDIGAYFSGKMVGGARMAESISPNKTWAGFGGALATPMVIGFIAMFLFTGVDGLSGVGLMMMSIAGVFVGLAGQGGDLLISAFKRKAGVKDTGTLIPGHGGLLDRIDSMLLAAPVFLVLYAVGHG